MYTHMKKKYIYIYYTITFETTQLRFQKLKSLNWKIEYEK